MYYKNETAYFERFYRQMSNSPGALKKKSKSNHKKSYPVKRSISK